MKTIFTNGDSWTFGSEMAAPELLAEPGEQGYGMFQRFKKDKNCYDKENDYYRIPRVWGSRLAHRMGAEAVIHAWPARSNDTIYRSTIDWILNEYSGDTGDLVVIVGWSGHERRNEYMEDLDGQLYEFTFWPSINNIDLYSTPEAREYFKFLVNHLWVQRETITRFIEHNFALHNFLTLKGIEHYFFSSFYVPRIPGVVTNEPKHWTKINVHDVLHLLHKQPIKGWFEPVHTNRDELRRITSMWDSIPERNFIFKESGETFKSYLDERLPKEQAYVGIHPSPEGHDLWAQFLYDYITGGTCESK